MPTISAYTISPLHFQHFNSDSQYDNSTPCFVACDQQFVQLEDRNGNEEYHQAECLALLIKAGADINATNYVRNTNRRFLCFARCIHFPLTTLSFPPHSS